MQAAWMYSSKVRGARRESARLLWKKTCSTIRAAVWYVYKALYVAKILIYDTLILALQIPQNLQCATPGCKKQKYPNPNGGYFDYCSLYCRENGLTSGMILL